MQWHVSQLYARYSEFFDRLEADIRRSCGPLSREELKARWGERLSREEFEEVWAKISQDEQRAQEWTARLSTSYDEKKNEMQEFIEQLFANAQS